MGYIASVAAGIGARRAALGADSRGTGEQKPGGPGGVEKLKALHSLRMTGKMQQGSFSMQIEPGQHGAGPGRGSRSP